MATISYSVPERTTSVFLILTNSCPDELSPTSDAVAVTRFDATGSPFDLADLWNYRDPDDDPFPWSAKHHIVVSNSARVRDQPLAAQLTRAHARRVATVHDGVLVDWLTGWRIHDPGRPERAEFRLSDHWLGFEDHQYSERHANIPNRDVVDRDWQPEDACAANRISTKGLSRFGLPEISIDDVDCVCRLSATNVLRATAQYLLGEHWAWLRDNEAETQAKIVAPALVTIPGTTMADFWRASVPGDPFEIDLAMVEGSLRVRAPNRQATSDWLRRLDYPIAYLAGYPPDDFANYKPLVITSDHGEGGPRSRGTSSRR
jgi:hypothetical protein